MQYAHWCLLPCQAAVAGGHGVVVGSTHGKTDRTKCAKDLVLEWSPCSLGRRYDNTHAGYAGKSRELSTTESQKPGLGFPLCRLVGLVCLGSGALLNAAVGRYKGKGGDEQSLLRTILDTLEAGDLLLGDAYYASYFLLCELQQRGVDGVFEQHGSRKRSTDFRRGKRLGKRDHLIELRKPTIKPGWMEQSTYDAAPV